MKILFSNFLVFRLTMIFFVSAFSSAQSDVAVHNFESDEPVKKQVDLVYYEDTEQLQRKTSDLLESYYDRNGDALGELKLKYENGSIIPWDGKRLVFDDQDGSVSDIISYRSGTRVSSTSFRKRLVTSGHHKVFKEVIDYEDSSENKKIKETSFYSYDKKQREVSFEDGKKVIGRFFDKSGNEIGVYDFQKKNGTRYVFFSNSDNVEKMQVFRDSALVNSKLFIQSKNSIYSRIQPILVYELNVDCCERFYSDEGELLTELKYLGRKPWEGIAFDRNDNSKYTYKKGLKNGAYEKRNAQGDILEEGQFKDDLKDGLFKYYQASGVLQNSELYSKGALNGAALYYDEKGEEISRMIYQDDKISDGTLVSDGYFSKHKNQQTFEGGEMTSKTFYSKKGKIVTTFKDGLAVETTVFHKDSDHKKLKYSIRNSALEGEVIRYDEDGTEEYCAELSNGKLVSGTLLLSSKNLKAETQNLKVVKTDEKLSVEVLGDDGAVNFKAEETLTNDGVPNYLSLLNEDLKFISYYRLY